MAKSLKERIIALKKIGKTNVEAHLLLRCSLSTISYHCKRAGINNLKYVALTDEQKNKVKEMFLNRVTIPEIAKQLNLKKHRIKRITKGLNRDKISPSKSVVNWRKRVKIRLIEYKGRCCEKCGYNKCVSAMHFHHKDPIKKSFSIGGKSWSYEKLKKEVDKCWLLCANCHIEAHEKIAP